MDSRLKRSLNNTGREDRASEDVGRKAAEEKLVSAQERRKMWSDGLTQEVLPKTPDIEGWHVCWLSTTNSTDPIHKRQRMGYVPVKADELPSGYEDLRVKSGEHIGFVSCNEMVLYKIPMDVYQDMMTYFHHDQPMEMADKVRIDAENLQGMRDSHGKSLKSLVSVDGEGIGSLSQGSNYQPVFSG